MGTKGVKRVCRGLRVTDLRRARLHGKERRKGDGWERNGLKAAGGGFDEEECGLRGR